MKAQSPLVLHIAPPKGTEKFAFKQSKYPHLDGIAPTRALEIGSSGVGTSLMITHLILNVFAHKWEKIYICRKQLKQITPGKPVDKFIRHMLKAPEEEQASYEDFDVEALNKIIDTQTQFVEHQKSKHMAASFYRYHSG